MKVTKHSIPYREAPYPYLHIIPKGTPVRPASNLPGEPGEQYWAEPWENMTEESESWQRTYGFLLAADKVEDA